MDNKSLVVRIIEIIAILGVIGILVVDGYLVIIQPESWLGNISEVTAPFIIFFLMPIMIFYINFKDYNKSVIENKVFIFWKTLSKGILISIFMSLFGVWIANFSASGEDKLGIALAAVFLPIISSIITILLTTAFYLISKNKISSKVQ